MLFVIMNIFLFGCLFAQGKFQNGNLLINTPPIQKIKDSLTSSQQKLGTDLLQLIDQRFLPEGATLQSYAETMKNMNQFRSNATGILDTNVIKEGEVYVYIYLKPDVLTEILNPLVTTITDTDKLNHVVVAWVKVKDLENIASLDGVKGVQSVIPPMINTGSVTTEGDLIHRTANVRNTYSQSGAGINVGIISDGVDTRASAQTSGDLPADGAGLTVQSNTVGGDEGTAMLEIVYDMVPSSGLYFHDCGANTVAFNSAIDALVSAGCKVICDDISWITEPFFEDGSVASHVASVLSGKNIIYVSSAGNAGGSHYQGDFYPISSAPTQHDFSHGTSGYYYLYINMVAGSSVRVVLEWNDQFGASGNDYDLSLYSYAIPAYVATSTNRQTGTSNPLEFISYTATASSAGDFAIVVNKYSGVAKTLEVYIYPSGSTSVYTKNITPVDAIFGHPAVVGAIAVGAVRATTPNTIEYFSSQGPCTITYPSSIVRSKPDVVGTDGVSITGAGGFENPFYGTSAAAPHVAAVAAQIWAAFPGETGNQIRDAIKSSAVDLGTTGFDYIYGYGRADALNAYDGLLPVELTSFTASVENYNAVMKWATATETNNYGFEIERRAMNNQQLTANNWEKIGFVYGNGTSSATHSYSFTDQTVTSGSYAYRLKQIDNDGVYKYSSEAEATITAPKVFVLNQNYPNPFNPTTVISYQLPVSGYVSLKVYDLLSREVAVLVNETKEAGNYEVKFDASKLTSGIYFMRLKSNGQQTIKKMTLVK